MLLTSKMKKKSKMQVKLKMIQNWMELKKMEPNPEEMDFLHVVDRGIKGVTERRIVMKSKKRVMRPVEKRMQPIKKRMMILKSLSLF
jgi:hypothetical protein